MLRVVYGAVVFMLGGCVTTGVGFNESGFYSAENAYTISYAGGTGELIDGSWRVANFAYDDGKPDRLLDGGSHTATLDWEDEDGDLQAMETRIFDLELSHRSNAVIWVRVVPVPERLRNKDVEVLAENYVNNLSGTAGTGYLGDGVITERRVATRILNSQQVALLGRRAQAVTFEVVSLDQLEMDPNAPRTKVELVLVDVPFWKRLVRGNTTAQVPGYLLVGYANDEAHFDEHLGTFRAFAKRLALAPPE